MGAPEKRMMKFVIIALALAVASAVPEGTFVQENMLLENAEFASAHEKVTNMLQEDTQARRSACVKAADASINNVFRDVQNSQRLLNRMNNGRRCATRNQHLINRAKRTISTRTRQVHVATNHLRHQRRSRIHWNFSFESLREGSCVAFYRSGQWQGAKRRVHHANRRLASARANLRAARNNLQVQIRNAKRVRKACRCAVLKSTARGKNLRVSAAHKRRLRLFRTRLAPGVAGTNCKKPVLTCHTRTTRSNNAGVIRTGSPGGYVSLGGGMVNNYRSWNKLGMFEEAMPEGNHFRCDTGFGPGRLTCYNRACKANVGGLSCTTRSVRFRGVGAREAHLPRGYIMTGGVLYNHYRHFNARAGFEETCPNGNRWRGDMGFGG